MMRFAGISLLVLLLAATSGLCDDWPQWRGVNRDGKSAETNLLTKWPDGGPQLLWSAEGLGKGFASVAVANSCIYTTGQVEGAGVLFAFELSGKPKWTVQYGQEWAGPHEGSHSTPTVDGNSVYIMSGHGQLACFEAETGKDKWSLNVLEKFSGENLRFGFAESVLIDGDKLFCTPGGPDASIVALDKNTGKTIWTTKGLSDQSAYCSPILIERGGTRLLVTMTSHNIVGIDPATGEVFWKHPHRNKRGNHPITPIYADGMIYATSGYGEGGVMLELSADGKSVEQKWTQKKMDCQHGGVVLVDGYLYGTGHNSGPKWFCVDLKTGEVAYEASGVGKGSVAYADGMLYCYGEKGTMGLVKPTPTGHKIISSFPITAGSSKHWAHPVISGGKLFIRHGDTLMVYKIQND